MASPLDASIVPITLTVNGRIGLTLYAPPWEDEDGEQWQGFLGDGAKIVLFPNATELAKFIASGEENDLSDHPAWGRVQRLSPISCAPDQMTRTTSTRCTSGRAANRTRCTCPLSPIRSTW